MNQAPATDPDQAAKAAKVEIVAHRGGLPENTLSAFKQALATPGVGAIELDVQVSKDGELFIMHDKTVDRTTTGKGEVASLTAVQMRELKTPRENGAEPVPTLDEVLDLVAATPDKRVLIEIKAPTPGDTADKVVASVNKHKLADRALVTSFDAPLVEATRKVASTQATAFVSSTWSSKVLSDPSPYLLIKDSQVTAQAVADAHKAGKKFYVWTVDDKVVMERFILLGVDGLISNQYALGIQVKESMSKQ
jgi:glycerophosphoryl diester phosphodiesterase